MYYTMRIFTILDLEMQNYHNFSVSSIVQFEMREIEYSTFARFNSKIVTNCSYRYQFITCIFHVRHFFYIFSW